MDLTDEQWSLIAHSFPPPNPAHRCRPGLSVQDRLPPMLRSGDPPFQGAARQGTPCGLASRSQTV